MKVAVFSDIHDHRRHGEPSFGLHENAPGEFNHVDLA
ncbi:hypothetical protein BH11VER1_BH11VER1_22880 [soil metagenome]